MSKISDKAHYYLDNLKISAPIKTKIEQFQYDANLDRIIVIYRLGRQKTLNNMEISHFEHTYFEKISGYDQLRLTKFSTLQCVLEKIFKQDSSYKSEFIHYIQAEAKNEQLF